MEKVILIILSTTYPHFVDIFMSNELSTFSNNHLDEKGNYLYNEKRYFPRTAAFYAVMRAESKLFEYLLF